MKTMKLNLLFLIFFLLSGCLSSPIVRKSSPEVPASKAKLKVEWTQVPVGENPALYPFGVNLRDGKAVEFSLVKLTNESPDRQEVRFDAPETQLLSLGLETFCPFSEKDVSQKLDLAVNLNMDHVKVPEIYTLLCRYESRWKIESLRIVRENGREEGVEMKTLNPTEPLEGRVDLRPFETIHLVAEIVPVYGALLPSKARPAGAQVPPQVLSGSVYVSPVSLPENDVFAAQHLLALSFEGPLKPVIQLGNGTPLYLGEPSRERKTFRTSLYESMVERLKLPVRHRPTVSGIPVFL